LVRYKCGRCGREFDEKDIELLPGIKCPYCGYRVIYKVGPATIRRVKAV